MTSEDALFPKLQHYRNLIIKELKFQSYHFIELYIYFSNFIEEERIEQDAFATANTTLLNPEEEDEEEVQGLSLSIFETISNNNTYANIPSLCAYLKSISISTAVEFKTDVLFSILDKSNKGYVDFEDIKVLRESIEEFNEEANDWEKHDKRLLTAKIDNLDLYKDFIALFKKIVAKANEKIQRLIDNPKEVPKQNGKTSNEEETRSVSGKGNKNNEMIIYRKSEQYNNEALIPPPLPQHEHEPIDEMLFDRGKVDLIRKIRRMTYLYDIDYDDILHELSIYEQHHFDKTLFISVMCDIICKKTSDLFLSPRMKLALSMLFQMIDVEHRNKLSFCEVLGGIIPLTKNSNRIDKMTMLSKYPKKKIFLFLSGGFALYLNTNKIKDLNVFSEIVYEEWLEAGIKSNIDLLKWIFSTDNDNNDDGDDKDNDRRGMKIPSSKNSDYRCDSVQIPVTPSPSDISSIIDGIREKYLYMKTKIPEPIRQLSILDLTNSILKYSFLGVINSFQISTLFDAVIKEKLDNLPQRAKNKLKADCIAGVERNFDFTQSELIDTTFLHAFAILIFSGSTIEKFQSIFLIYDLKENEAIDYDDFCNYLTNLFSFVMKQTTIDWCNSHTLAKIICEYIITHIDKKITLTCLMQAYDSLTHYSTSTKKQ